MKAIVEKVLRCTFILLLAGVLVFANGERAASMELVELDTMSREESTEAGTEAVTEGTELPAEEPEEEIKFARPKLKLVSKPGGKIKLSWKAVEGAEEYILCRSTQKNRDFRIIQRLDAPAKKYVDEGLAQGTVYYYRLTAISEELNQSKDSKIVSGCSLGQAKLTEISNLSGSRLLVLKWEPVQGAAAYQIARLDAESGTYKKIATVKDDTGYTDTNRTGGTIYSYKVCAVDASGGCGSYSKPMSQMAIDANKKMIALTYDDGPSANTPTVLNALEKYDAHATFFVIGYSVDRYSDSLRREIALGCEIGNHTYNHEMLKNISTKEIQATLEKVNTAVKKQTGVDIRVMRPPGGGQNETVRAAVGMPVIIWSVDTLDWKTRSTSATIDCVKKEARDGAIVLMHDLHKPTADAAEAIISYLKAEGYQMVTISEMAAYRGGMEAGKSYTQFKK